MLHYGELLPQHTRADRMESYRNRQTVVTLLVQTLLAPSPCVLCAAGFAVVVSQCSFAARMARSEWERNVQTFYVRQSNYNYELNFPPLSYTHTIDRATLQTARAVHLSGQRTHEI